MGLVFARSMLCAVGWFCFDVIESPPPCFKDGDREVNPMSDVPYVLADANSEIVLPAGGPLTITVLGPVLEARRDEKQNAMIGVIHHKIDEMPQADNVAYFKLTLDKQLYWSVQGTNVKADSKKTM